MKARRLLLVAYDFPPAGGSGVQRSLKFARYLPACGWHVTVLCCGHDRRPLHDPELLDELTPLGDAVRVVRVPGLEPAGVTHLAVAAIGGDRAGLRWLHERVDWRLEPLARAAPLPEPAWLWSLAASRTALRLTRSQRFDAVMTSGPPHSVHLIGRTLQRRRCLPWVADLRDPIITNFAYSPRGRHLHAYWSRLESSIVREADQPVVTCDDLAADLALRHGVPPTRLTTITNGWDPADFANLPAAGAPMPFRLVYVGAFYRQQSISPILSAFRELMGTRPELRGRLLFEHVGSLAASQKRELRGTDDAFLLRRGYRTHREALATMTKASALLLTVPPGPGGRLCIPAKTFEYLASVRPMIALAHPGTSMDGLLRAAGDGIELVAPDRPERLSSAIVAAYERHCAGAAPPSRDPRLLHDTRRDVLARRLAEVLDRARGTPEATPDRRNQR